MVSLEVGNGVARLRLARPDRHNAIDHAPPSDRTERRVSVELHLGLVEPVA